MSLTFDLWPWPTYSSEKTWSLMCAPNSRPVGPMFQPTDSKQTDTHKGQESNQTFCKRRFDLVLKWCNWLVIDEVIKKMINGVQKGKCDPWPLKIMLKIISSTQLPHSHYTLKATTRVHKSNQLQAFNHKEILYMQFRSVYHPSHSETFKIFQYETHKLINCCMRYHDGLSGLICRAFSQPPSYKETFSFRTTQGLYLQTVAF